MGIKKVQITRYQHFVWRAYLANWAVDGKVFRKDVKRALFGYINPRNILGSKFMYKFPILNDAEILQFNNRIQSLNLNQGPGVRMYLDLLKRVSVLQHLIDQSEQEERNSSFEKIIKEGFEKSHSVFESMGLKLINITNARELLSVLKKNVGEKKIELFVLMQYFRTQNMQKVLAKVLDGENEEIVRALEVFLPPLFSEYIAERKIASFKILENNTSELFLTSEQPVVNVSEDIDSNGNYKYFSLYYPINPTLAIVISFDDKDTYIETDACDSAAVKYYNKFMLCRDIIVSRDKF